MSCQSKNLRVARLQLLYSRLETKLTRKCEIFSIYITILNNKKTFENSRIKTRLSIANVRRDFTLFQSLSIAILYRFKTIIKFPSISTIKNAIINYMT